MRSSYASEKIYYDLKVDEKQGNETNHFLSWLPWKLWASKASIRFCLSPLEVDLSTNMTLVPEFLAMFSIVSCWRILMRNSRISRGGVLVF
jgi:hypothetical protein